MHRACHLESLSRWGLLIVVLTGCTGTAQAGPLFTRVAAGHARATALKQPPVAGSTLLEIDAAALASFRAQGGGTLVVPGDAGVLELELTPYDVVAGQRVLVTDATGTHPADAGVSLFRGRIPSDPTTWAVIAMSDRGVMGTIESREGRRVLGPAGQAAPGTLALHVLASDSAPPDPTRPAWTCGVEGPDAERALRNPDARPRSLAPPGELQIAANRIKFDIAIDCDNEIYFDKFGGDLTAATSYMLVVLGTTSLIYERDLAIILTYPYLNFWTTGDPYTSTTTSAQLPQFRSYWLANRTGVSRSLAHLVSGRSLGGGIAYLDALCSSFGYGVSGIDANYNYPTNTTTWDVEVLAHELGHNFGSPHTHSCYWQSVGYVPPGAVLDTCYAAEGGCNAASPRVPPDKGTIMSYCHQRSGGLVNIRLDFHPVCVTEMRLTAEASSCEGLVAFQPPSQLLATPTPTGTLVSWTAGTTSGVLGYDVHRSQFQLDLNAPKHRSTPVLSIADTTFGTWYYRVRAIRAADTSQWSGELKTTVCSLQGATIFPAGTDPVAAAHADFNEDGIEDLVIANSSAASVAVLLGLGSGGTGNGAFAAPVTYPAGAGASCVVTGDWNADGITDLAVGNSTAQTVTILLGQGSGSTGNGTFASGSTVSGVAEPSNLARGDFDEDGIDDLVVAGGGADATILHGNGAAGAGNGTFSVTSVLNGGSEPKAVLVADPNEDGISDLIVAHSSGARVLLGGGTGGKGNGAFAAGVDYTCGASPASLAIADFNRDGVLDLVAGNSGSQSVSVLLGQGAGGTGDGTFGTAASFDAGDTPFGVRVADWSGDGIADVMVANATGAKTISLLVGGGTGSIGDGTLGARSTFATSHSGRATLLDDFDGDEAPDVITVNRVGATLNVIKATCMTPLSTALELSSPNGGEAWIEGEERAITWTQGAGVLAVHVELSRDAGANWRRIADNVVGTGLTWTVTQPYSAGARFRVVDATIGSRRDASDAVFSIGPEVPVAVGDGVAPMLALGRAIPNPARHHMTISLSLPDDAPATLELLDLAGRRVSGQSVGMLGAGRHQVALTPPARLPQGVYLVRLSRAGETRSMKVALLQ